MKLNEYKHGEEDEVELTTEELKTIEDSIGFGFGIASAGAALALLNKTE